MIKQGLTVHKTATNRQTEKKTNRQTPKHTSTQTHKQIKRQTYKAKLVKRDRSVLFIYVCI